MSNTWIVRTPGHDFRFVERRRYGQGEPVDVDSESAKDALFFATCELHDRDPEALEATLELYFRVSSARTDIMQYDVQNLSPNQVEQLATWLTRAVASGLVGIQKQVAVRTRPWKRLDEAPVLGPVSADTEPESLPKEDICWPCQRRAAASARTLCAAAKAGAPFVANA
jgi:hypothetical protein